MTPERVAAAGAAWLWWPSDATVVRDDRLVLVRWPDHYRVAPTVVRVAADAPVAATLEAAVDRAREWGSAELLVWVKPDAPAGLEAALRSRGGVHDDTVDVFALDLAGGVPDLAVPADVEVRWQLDEATTRDVIQVGIEAFEEGAVPDDERVLELAAEAAADHRDRRGACAVGYLGAHAAGGGGLSMAGDVVRLWGGGVVPDARGRGVYRAVLDARLRHAVSLGARMALVKGRVETSGPILRRVGFTAYGQERCYVLPVADRR